MTRSIRVRDTLPEDPRLARLAELTGLPADQVLGALLRLWIWSVRHAAGGIAPVTTAWVDEYAGHTGFAAALVQVGWLEARLHEVCFVNFCEYGRTPRKPRLEQADQQVQAAQQAEAIPERLNTPGFRTLWQDWIEHRHAMRRPLTPPGIRRQLAKLEQMGLRRACAALEHSLEKGWLGIFEPASASQHQEQSQQQKQQKTRQSEDDLLQQRIAKQLAEQTRARHEEERLRREREQEHGQGSVLFRRLHEHEHDSSQPQRGERDA